MVESKGWNWNIVQGNSFRVISKNTGRTQVLNHFMFLTDGPEKERLSFWILDAVLAVTQFCLEKTAST